MLRTILTVLLALAWMPLTAHCQIERLTGLQVLQCSSLEAGAPAGGSHCDGDTCCAWESGHYQLPQEQPAATVTLLELVPTTVESVASCVTMETSAGVEIAPRRGWPKPWQFCLRAALPVRAPSLLS